MSPQRRERRVPVESALRLIHLRQDAVKAGRETRPWASGDRFLRGLYDPDAPGGPILYTITKRRLSETRGEKAIPITVRIMLGSIEGWEAVFGGPILYFD